MSHSQSLILGRRCCSDELLRLVKQTTAIDIEIASHLLENYADPNCREDTGMTTTHFAAKNGHIEVLRMILNLNGAQKCVDQRDNHGMNVLHFAASNIDDDIKAIDVLFENEKIEIDVHKTNKMNQTALDIAKQCKNYKIANHLQSRFDNHANIKEEEMKKPYIASTDNESSHSLQRVLYDDTHLKEAEEIKCDDGQIDCAELWTGRNIKREAIKGHNDFVDFYKKSLWNELDNVYLKCFELHDLNCLAILDEIDDDILQFIGISKRFHRQYILRQIQKYLTK